MKNYKNSKVEGIIRIIESVEKIIKILEKVLNYLENEHKNDEETIDSKEDAKRLVTGSEFQSNSDKIEVKKYLNGKYLDDSTLGHLMLLNCGHNGIPKKNEFRQYELHLVSAGIINE